MGTLSRLLDLRKGGGKGVWEVISTVAGSLAQVNMVYLYDCFFV
jgi:hypothetical protein